MVWDAQTSQIWVRVQLRGATSLEPIDDRFVLALSEDGVLPSLFLQVRPLLHCGDADACGGAGQPLAHDAIEYSEASGITSLTWSAPSTTNPSASFAVVHPWIAVAVHDDGPTTTYDWTLSFALEVPTDAVGQVVDGLSVYGNILDRQPGPTSDTHLEFPLLCTSGSPTTDTCLIDAGGGSPQLPGDLPADSVGGWTSLSSTCGG